MKESVQSAQSRRNGSCVVFLKGINLGAHNRVPMADLQAMMRREGLPTSHTYLQSGNLLIQPPFESLDQVATTVKACITTLLGKECPALVIPTTSLERVLGSNPLPFDAGAGSRMMVHLLSAPLPDGKPGRDEIAAISPSTIAVGERCIYQWCPDGFVNAPAVAKRIEPRYDLFITTRNWNTLTEILRRLTEPTPQ